MALRYIPGDSLPYPQHSDPAERIRTILDRVSHCLPAQGPISVFIHHNTLHAFEELPFHEALAKSGRIFGCEPYLFESRFHRERQTGRILDEDLDAVLREDLGNEGSHLVSPHHTRFDLRRQMLHAPVWTGTFSESRWLTAELRWAETESLRWSRCLELSRTISAQIDHRSPLRIQPRLRKATGIDADEIVNDVLIRFTAAYLDQGVADRPLPNVSFGFLASFCELYRAGSSAEIWAKAMAELCGIELSNPRSAAESIRESLTDLGIPETQWESYFEATLLLLRGWTGMIHQVEVRGDRVHYPIREGSYYEFVAVRLILDRAVLSTIARDELGHREPLATLSTRLPDLTAETESELTRAVRWMQIALALNLPPDSLTEAWVREVESFTPLARRKLFHLAYERRLRIRTLDALALRVREPLQLSGPVRFQLITCLDEREESLRRHVEEIAPDSRTFGAAGFFAVPMYYRGAADAHFVPLCPIVLTPKHWVTERVDDHALADHERKAVRRATIGRVSHRFHVGTRTPIVGSLLAAIGSLATIPLVARILCPRLTAKIRGTAGAIMRTPPHTTLALERTDDTPGDHNGMLGFDVNEMTDMGERLLRDIGLIDEFAKLVVVLGHGSGSLNNPHLSAYDCGACGGSPGAPNSRAIAQVLNDSRVRERLNARGITIPPSTWVVGGLHNTCDDSIRYFDTDRIPNDLLGEFDRLRNELSAACDRNAHERCRRFESCPITATPAEAHRHVEARSEDLAQARPELGHATNAICIVGRRSRTRGLFFDRRAFLTSYDPTQDAPDAAILARTLGAVFPVCGGINLEYLFSHIDPAGYGCGTKLPHNVTALLGVMDGAASDLRTGLPWQMTEIHEPVRLLIVIESTVELLTGIMNANPTIGGMTRHGWVQVALLHPETGAISVFEDSEFRPYEASPHLLRRVHSSAEWYAGKRDHLEFVEILGSRA